MAFNATSYFAGVGTVAVALAIGFGGALVVTDINHKPPALNRLERVASVAADAAAPSGAQADMAIRRVEDRPLTASAEKDQGSQAHMASLEPAAVPVAAASQPAASGGEKAAQDRTVDDRPRETRKAIERERLDRRKRDQARVERRKPRDRDTPALAQRQAPVIQEVVESRETPSPRLSLFGED